MYLNAVPSPLFQCFPYISYISIGFYHLMYVKHRRLSWSKTTTQQRHLRYKMKMNNCEAKWVMENRIFRLCMAFYDWGLYCYGVLFRRCCAFLCGCLLCDEYQMKWWWLDVVIHAFADGYKIMIILKMCMYHLVPYR